MSSQVIIERDLITKDDTILCTKDVIGFKLFGCNPDMRTTRERTSCTSVVTT